MIFLFTRKDSGQPHIDTIHWVLDFLQKKGLFVNLKKCQFYQDKVYFLEYVVLAQGIQMKDKKIEVVKNWLEPKSVRDIQVFPSFANFYCCFI